MDRDTTQQHISIMKFHKKNDGSRSSRGRNSFRRKKEKKIQKFVEPESWVSKNKEISDSDNQNVKLTSDNFPELNINTACTISQESNHKISYNIQDLFKKKREKNKKKEELKPGWIKLFYKDGKICQISGPPAPPCYDATRKLREIEIQKMIERHEFYEEWYQLNHIPYWKEQDTTIDDELDYYPGDTESEEEDDEYEYDTEDEYYDNNI
jgi:hypothetical protein